MSFGCCGKQRLSFLTLERNSVTNWSILGVVKTDVFPFVGFQGCWLVGLLFCRRLLLFVCLRQGFYCTAQDGLELVILRWYWYRNTGKLWGFEKGKEALTSESD